MRPAVPLLALAAALALTACGPSQDATPAQPPPPADAPAPPPAEASFTRPLNALGNEPFWALKIRPDGLTFSAAGAKDVTAANPGPQATADQAVWTAMGSDGKPLVATLKSAVCEDSGSGQTYPFTATVQAGGRTLTGCAAYAEAMPKAGG